MALGDGGVFSIIKFVGDVPLAGASGIEGFVRSKGIFEGSEGKLGKARGIFSGGITRRVSLVSL